MHEEWRIRISLPWQYRAGKISWAAAVLLPFPPEDARMLGLPLFQMEGRDVSNYLPSTGSGGQFPDKYPSRTG